MKRSLFLLYGIFCYLMFFASFNYFIGFTGNLFVPKGIDGPLSVPLWQALLTNLGLILLFGVQHSIMARTWFKKWWTQYVPQAIERSTFVLFSSLTLIAIMYFWQPLGGTVWTVENYFLQGVLYASFALGWVMVFVSSFLINHFDLFGLRQVWLHFRGKEYTDLNFKTPLLYKFVRHPLYLGVVIGLWSAVTMSYTRLFLAIGLTAYILRAIPWEEQDLVKSLGRSYRQYQTMVPRLLPFFGQKKKPEAVYQSIAKSRKEELVHEDQ